MRIKADWTSYLHNLRRRELDVVFDLCPPKLFDKVLEIGAGDGFVSGILADYCGHLICTDLNTERLRKTDHDNITFKICDAEEIGQTFSGERFDMIFSSCLLEHLPDLDKALRGIHDILAEDGITIHLLPNRLWKLATVLFYIPNNIVNVIDKALAGRLFKRRPGHRWFRPYKEQYGGRNIKIGRRRQFFLSKLFLPAVHGVSDNTIAEFIAFGKKKWVDHFMSADFKILAVKKVCFNSGYGFGFDRLRKMMESLGLANIDAYIVCRTDGDSRYGDYFRKVGMLRDVRATEVSESDQQDKASQVQEPS